MANKEEQSIVLPAETKKLSRFDFIMLSGMTLGLAASWRLASNFLDLDGNTSPTESTPIGNTNKALITIFGSHINATKTEKSIIDTGISPNLFLFEAMNAIRDSLPWQTDSDKALGLLENAILGTNEQAPLEMAVKRQIPIVLPDVTTKAIDLQTTTDVINFVSATSSFSIVYDMFAQMLKINPNELNSKKVITNVAKLLLLAPSTSEFSLLLTQNRQLKNAVRAVNQTIIPYLETIKGQGRDLVFAAKTHMMAHMDVIPTTGTIAFWGENHIQKQLISDDTETLYKQIRQNRTLLKLLYTTESLTNVVYIDKLHRGTNGKISGQSEYIKLEKMKELLAD